MEHQAAYGKPSLLRSTLEPHCTLAIREAKYAPEACKILENTFGIPSQAVVFFRYQEWVLSRCQPGMNVDDFVSEWSQALWGLEHGLGDQAPAKAV